MRVCVLVMMRCHVIYIHGEKHSSDIARAVVQPCPVCSNEVCKMQTCHRFSPFATPVQVVPQPARSAPSSTQQRADVNLHVTCAEHAHKTNDHVTPS